MAKLRKPPKNELSPIQKRVRDAVENSRFSVEYISIKSGLSRMFVIATYNGSYKKTTQAHADAVIEACK